MKKFLLISYCVVMEIIQLPIGILVNIVTLSYATYTLVQDKLTFREIVHSLKELYANSFKDAFELKKQVIVDLTEK